VKRERLTQSAGGSEGGTVDGTTCFELSAGKGGEAVSSRARQQKEGSGLANVGPRNRGGERGEEETPTKMRRGGHSSSASGGEGCRRGGAEIPHNGGGSSIRGDKRDLDGSKGGNLRVGKERLEKKAWKARRQEKGEKSFVLRSEKHPRGKVGRYPTKVG